MGVEQPKTFPSSHWTITDQGSWYPAGVSTLRGDHRNLYLDALSEPHCGEEATLTKQGLLTASCTYRHLWALLQIGQNARHLSWPLCNSIWFFAFQARWRIRVSSSIVIMQSQDVGKVKHVAFLWLWVIITRDVSKAPIYSKEYLYVSFELELTLPGFCLNMVFHFLKVSESIVEIRILEST